MSNIFLIIFAVFMAVCIPMLIYFAKKHPDPRFRPNFGELTLMGLLMIAGSAGLAYLMQGLFVVDDIKLRPDSDRTQGPVGTPPPPEEDSYEVEDAE